MGIDLHDIKPFARSLTGFNGSSEIILGTIRLPVYACGVTRTVKFSVVSTKVPYHVILGTLWIHLMHEIPSTYHQCIKFPGIDCTIKTLRGDQQACRELLSTTVKLQRTLSHVNSISPPFHKVSLKRKRYSKCLSMTLIQVRPCEWVHICPTPCNSRSSLSSKTACQQSPGPCPI